MKEYKMRRGEYLEERIPDLESTVEEFFGPISGTEEYNGSELFVVGDPSNPVFERVVVGAVSNEGKKDTLAVDFEERDPTTLSPDELEAAGEAVAKKNEFLLEATGRNAKSRRKSMKRSVDDSDTPEGVS